MQLIMLIIRHQIDIMAANEENCVSADNEENIPAHFTFQFIAFYLHICMTRLWTECARKQL